VYRDIFGRGSITGTAMQKNLFFFDKALKFIFTSNELFYLIISNQNRLFLLFWFNILLFCGGILARKSSIHVV
jgi:hypothetical protein